MFSFGSKSRAYLNELLGRRPAARAQIRGDANHPSLSGDVSFYPVNGGVLVLADDRRQRPGAVFRFSYS